MKLGKINPAKLRHALRSRKRIIIFVAALLVGPIILVQLLYPGNVLLPNTTIESVHIGGISKQEATKKLDTAYAQAKVPVYFTDSDEAVIEPALINLGITTSNEARVAAFDYPFIWRIVPSSLFWYQTIMEKGEPTVARDDGVFAEYVTTRFGDNCEFEPVNGTITYVSGELQVVPAARGGSCDINELTAKLSAVDAQLNPARVTISGTSTAPEISTIVTRAEYDRLIKELDKGVELKVQDTAETIPADTVAQWVEYSVQDAKLSLGLNTEKSSKWLSDKYAKQFTSDPGVTTVTTRDFAEASRETGKNGQVLNTASTATEITKRLKGEAETAKLVIDTIEPSVVFKRTYSSSNQGLSAVMKNYADSHPGTYGVKLVELSGARRNAEYNSSKQFTTASTYKLFVAYSILLRIERGDLQWSSPSYGGYDVSACFDRMIELSNNECAIDLLRKVGYSGVTNDARAIGATNTSFMGNDGIKSTAADEALLLSMLHSGQILTQQASRDKLINTMKRNVYVKGIPSGIPNAEVADKVGFLDALLHDAAIVYSPKGTYVLVILTNNASWTNIAELTKELEAVR